MMDRATAERIWAALPSYGETPALDMLADGWICAFTNEDDEYSLAPVVAEQAAAIRAGIALVEEMTGTRCAGLIAPTQAVADAFTDLVLEVTEQVSVRNYPNAVFLHPLRLLQLADAAQGKGPVCWVSVNGAEVQTCTAPVSLRGLLPDFDGKALLIGHRFYPPEMLDTVLDGSFDLGSGSIRVIEKASCIVQCAEAETLRLYRRSCGICTFCREGLYQLWTTLVNMEKPNTPAEKLALLEELGTAIPDMTLCTLGKAAAAPFMTAMTHWPEEVRAHIGRGKCPAGKCSGYLNIYIDPVKCQGEGDCMDVCPKGCIDGKRGFISVIDDLSCDKCGKCVAACKNHAVILTGGRVPRLPTRPTRVGRFR